MKPDRIILVRHAESEGNVDRSVYAKIPDYKLGLSPSGVEQAVQLGGRLKALLQEQPAMFYVSPFWRTRQTFEYLAQSLANNALKVREEPRLREQDWGHLRSASEGSEIEKQRDAYGAFYFRIPDGESCADVYDRVTTFLETLHRDFEKPDFPVNAVLVTHGMAMRLFLMRWFQWSVEEFESVKNPANCAMIVMQKGLAGKYSIEGGVEKWGNL